MDRRSFLLLTSSTILTGCDLIDALGKKSFVRFAVASDGHYGEPGIDSDRNYSTLVTAINDFHHKSRIDFCVINGDLVHDNGEYLPAVKSHLEQLKMHYMVTKGNHDIATEEQWRAVFGMPFDFDFQLADNAFLFLNSSDYAGRYLCPDLEWLRKRLDHYAKSANIFLFMHINPAAQTKFSVDCQEILALFAQYKNIRAVFNGHDHDHDQVLIRNNIPYIFDGRFGGSWGMNYQGFRIVEINSDNSVLTYMMNPGEKLPVRRV